MLFHRASGATAKRARWGGVGCLGARYEPRWACDVAKILALHGRGRECRCLEALRGRAVQRHNVHGGVGLDA